MSKVLFVCVGNSRRSVMAERLFRQAAGGRHKARSAGSDPGPAVHPQVLEALGEVGSDASDHRPRRLDEEAIGWADVIVATCDDACPGITGQASSPVATMTSAHPIASSSRRRGLWSEASLPTSPSASSTCGWTAGPGSEPAERALWRPPAACRNSRSAITERRLFPTQTKRTLLIPAARSYPTRPFYDQSLPRGIAAAAFAPIITPSTANR